MKYTSRYYRIIRISEEIFDQWLNLPKGFTVDAVNYEPLFRILELRINCPHSKQFKVSENEAIPDSMPLAHTNRYGFLVKLWHPDLGQKEPKDRIRKVNINDYVRRR